MCAECDEVVDPIIPPVEVVQTQVEKLCICGILLSAEGQHIVDGPGPFPVQCLRSVHEGAKSKMESLGRASSADSNQWLKFENSQTYTAIATAMTLKF